MLTPEDLRLTEKYLEEYGHYCENTLCGSDCPVFQEHQTHMDESCFKIYCRLRESGILQAPSK